MNITSKNPDDSQIFINNILLIGQGVAMVRRYLQQNF